MTKILASKNMASIKAEALSEVDELWAVARMEVRGASADIHTAKYLEAVTGAGPLLKAEAKATGVGLGKLVETVISRHEEQLETLANMEAVRQQVQEKIRAATNPIEVARIMKGIRE